MSHDGTMAIIRGKRSKRASWNTRGKMIGVGSGVALNEHGKDVIEKDF